MAKLKEDTIQNVFGKEDSEFIRSLEGKHTIPAILDHMAEEAEEFYETLASIARRGKKLPSAKSTNVYNPLFVGPTGAGKTSIISTWARDHGYGEVSLNMMSDALDFLGVKVIDRDHELELKDKDGNVIEVKKADRVKTIPTQAFDMFLNPPHKILFLDEINKTNPRILQSLYDLISFHIITNGDEAMELPYLTFTIGAMNPTSYGGGREALDPALRARMKRIDVDYDTAGVYKYLKDTLSVYAETTEEDLTDLHKDSKADPEKIKKFENKYNKYVGRLRLVNALFSDMSKFNWSSDEEIRKAGEQGRVLVPRTLEAAIMNCNGTKEDFLKIIKEDCGDSAYSTIYRILAGYQDKAHKANDIWGKDYSVSDPNKDAENAVLQNSSPESKEAGKPKQSLYDKIKANRPDKGE